MNNIIPGRLATLQISSYEKETERGERKRMYWVDGFEQVVLQSEMFCSGCTCLPEEGNKFGFHHDGLLH